MRLHLLILPVIFLNVAAAQSRLVPSLLGYAYDVDSHAVRAVRGIPGAALVSDALEASLETLSAAVSPVGSYALVVAASGDVQLMRWDSEMPPVAVDGALRAPDSIVFSPAGAAALLYDRRSGRAQLLTGLPDAPAVRDLPPPETATFAVADNGTVAMATPYGVQLIAADQTVYFLPFPGAPAVLAFDSSGVQLLAVTASGELYLASRPDAGLDVIRIPSAPAQTLQPLAARFSPDSAAVIVATATGAITVIDRQTGSAQVLDCHCTPTLLQPFGRVGLYRLTDISNHPMMLVDAASDSPRVWFVPARAGGSEQ